jgi:predicted RNA-binding protein (virulence factor B family)
MTDKKIADTTEPLDALVGSCGCFKVVSVVKGEAFLNCGLSKDLFVPKAEQLDPMRVGQSYIVFVYRDERNGRIVGSSKLHKYLYVDAPDGLKEKDEVDLLIYGKTALGYKVVVGKDAWGVLYKNEVFKDLTIGQKVKGYVKKIRPDGKLDLSLERQGFREHKSLSSEIINYLKTKGQASSLSDKTPAEDIYRLFGVSKNKFKMAAGMLYKERKIDIKEGCFKSL